MSWSHAIDTWIVVAGILCALPCALLGNFMLLRRLSMMGDAISHAVLPGLAVAFLVTGSRSSLPMFIGAAAVGLLTALFTQWIARFGNVDRGAAMGIVFTALFAVGLILIVQVADHVDLDPGCVLYGAIEFTPLDLARVGPWEVPRTVLVLVPVGVIDALAVTLLFKELRICAFDPELASTLGIDARILHSLLMALVAVTTVACFESIGSILVIAMLIVPPAAAHLLTDRLLPMIVVSLLFAAVAAALGHVGAVALPVWLGALGWFERTPETSTAGMMAVTAGAMFLLVMLMAPRHGVLVRVARRRRLTARILGEDALGLLFRLEEAVGADDAALAARDVAEALGIPTLRARLVLFGLQRSGRIARRGGAVGLTEAGRRSAARLVRTHRLWEIFLHRRLAVAADHVHGTAHRMEHVTGGELLARLEADADVDRDPHGRRLPEDP